MKFLVEKGAEITTLPLACVTHDKMEALKYLIDQGANISEMSSTHAPALFVAVSQKSQKYVELLVENGADLSQSFNGETLLSIAAKLEHMELFRYLLAHGAPISPVGAKFSPLFTGIRKHNMEVVSSILALGADPNSFMINKNNKPYYPLDVAISAKCHEAITLLIMFGANTSLVTQKRTSDDTLRETLEAMKLENIVIKNKAHDKLKKMKTRFTIIKGEILSFVQKIIEKPGSTPATVVNILNEIRKLFSECTQFMVDMTPISIELDEITKPILKRQIEIYNESQKIPAQKSKTYVFNDGRKLSDQEEAEMNENRMKLAEMAVTSHIYTHLATKAFMQISNLKEESIAYISESTKELTESKNGIEASKITPTALTQMGIPSYASGYISKNTEARSKIIDETLLHLREHKQRCDELGGIIINCIRESAK